MGDWQGSVEYPRSSPYRGRIFHTRVTRTDQVLKFQASELPRKIVNNGHSQAPLNILIQMVGVGPWEQNCKLAPKSV